MKTETKNLENCQVQLNVTLDAEEVQAIVKDVEKTFMREVQIPGFRKGHVPLPMIRKEFASGLKQETERAIYRKYYEDAVNAAAIRVVAPVGVQEISFDANGGCFEVVVEVWPTFKMPAYKGLKIADAEINVDDAAVQDQINRLRAASAKFENAKEGEAVGEGDFVQIDYEGTIGGKKIIEINPEAKVVAAGQGFWTQVEEGRFLPEILDALVGMKAGETKTDIKAKFDKDAAPEGLKGEKAVYTVTLKSFRRRILPTDAELLERAKAESLEKLSQTIREAMEQHIAKQEAARRENEVIEQLLKKADFDVPLSQVRRSQDSFLKDFAQRAQYSGLDADYFKKNSDNIMKDAEDAAFRQVRLWYILNEIFEAEQLESKDDEFGKVAIDFVLANAKR